MRIREYTPADLAALRRIHAAQGFTYTFPNIDDPLFVSKLILEDDSGRIAMAALARLTCEMYLLVDREENADVVPVGAQHAAPGARPWHAESTSAFGRHDTSCPYEENGRNALRRGGAGKRDVARARYAQFLELHRAGEWDLLARGLEDAHAWLPPAVARRFGRRLAALGWTRDDAWTPYSRKLGDR